MPLNIDFKNRKVLVVGGGAVAERKIRILLAADAEVHVIALHISEAINQLAKCATITLEKRAYHINDIADSALVVAATNNTLLNKSVAEEARKRNILVNVTDAPELGNCTFPAILRRGNLEISVSTNGTCPGFAASVRDYISTDIGEEFGILLETLAQEREKLLTEGNLNTYNTQVLRSRIRGLIKDLINHKERVL